jgi:Coenzyme PQQ synthesis protein D (PqqD)
MGPSDDRPAARTSGLVVKALRDAILIYDLAQHRAHSLNRLAAEVWRAFDGTRTAGQIAALLREADLPVADEAVRYALAELGKTRLLASPVVESGLTRRPGNCPPPP